MKKHNLILQAALMAAFAGVSGAASAAATLTMTSTDYAKETCQTTTVFTLPALSANYVAGVASIQDFYVTFTLTNGTFAANPTATNTNGGTATQVAGGAGANSVTYRIDGSATAWAAGDSVALDAGTTIKTASCAAAVTVAASNGLLFIGGAVASPLEMVTVTAPGAVATFTDAVTITMAETGTDPIDLNPTPTSNSRLVFGPAAALDAANAFGATSAQETTTMAARQLAIAVGAQMEPDGTTPFSAAIDDLLVTLQSPFDTSSIATLCLDSNSDATCQAGEEFNLTTGVATIAGGSWASNGGFLLNNNGTAFAPRNLTLNYSLSVKTDGTRAGMTAHSYAYAPAAPFNNVWTLAYANGTLLRSQWFVSDAGNSSTMRLVNAGSVAALVVDAKYYLDSGVTGSVVGLSTVAAKSGKNLPINVTSIPGLAAGTASRGYIEVVIAGDLTNVDGSMITYGNVSGDRTIAVMRNVTFDTGVRSNTQF